MELVTAVVMREGPAAAIVTQRDRAVNLEATDYLVTRSACRGLEARGLDRRNDGRRFHRRHIVFDGGSFLVERDIDIAHTGKPCNGPGHALHAATAAHAGTGRRR